MQDFSTTFDPSYNFLAQPQDDYLQKLLSLDNTINAFPPSFTTVGASSPEDASASASPESSADGNASSSTMPRSVPLAAGTHEKRKGDSKGGALKDRRASGGASTGAHTHNEHNEEDEDDGKGGKNKTSEKRKLQNRQAQRNFRERKEKHLKELEDRVLSLEQQTTDQGTENAALKQLLERLQSENERLKVFESAFSFSYAKDVAPSEAMPVSASFKPPTPPTAQDEVDDITSFPLGSFSSMPGSGSGSFNAGGNTSFSTGASLFDASPSAFVLPQTTSAGGSFTASPPTFDDSVFFSSLTNSASPASTNGGAPSTASSAHVPTPPDTSDLFAAYRDPSFGVPTLTSLNDFDTLFGNPTGGLDDPLAQFIASPSPPSLAAATTTSTPPLSATAKPSPPLMNVACPYGPKTQDGKYEFDVDGLCAEMKLKATCQEAAREALRSAMKEDADSVAAAYPGQL